MSLVLKMESSRAIVRISLPAIASMAVETVLGFVDTYWVSRLGVEAVSAISASTYLLWVIFSMVDIIAVGLVSLSAYYYGRKDHSGMSKAFYTAFYSVLFLSFLISLLLIFNVSAYSLLFKIGIKGRIWLVDYLLIQGIFLPVAGLYYLMASLYEGLGRTGKVFRSSLIVLVLNSLLDPVMIFALGLNLKGAALASVVSRAIGVVYLWAELTFTEKGFSSSMLLKMVTIGAPSSIYWLASTGVFIYINSLASSINPASVAAMGVGVRYEMLPYIISMGISIAAAAVVGQSKGAGEFKKLEEASVFSLKLMLLISVGIGIIFFFLARPLSSLFLKGEAVNIAVMYLRISAFSQIFFSLSIVFEGIFIGMGFTAIPLSLALILIILRIPLSHIFHSLLWIFMLFPLTNMVIVLVFMLFWKFSMKKL